MATWTGNGGLFTTIDKLIDLHLDAMTDAAGQLTKSEAIQSNIASYTQDRELDDVIGGQMRRISTGIDPRITSNIRSIARSLIVYWVTKNSTHFVSSSLNDAVRELISMMLGSTEASPFKTAKRLATSAACETTTAHDEIALRGAPPVLASLLTGDGVNKEHVYNEDIRIRVSGQGASGKFIFTGTEAVGTSHPLWPAGSGVSRSLTATPASSGILADTGSSLTNWQVTNDATNVSITDDGKVAILVETATGLPGDPLTSDWGTYDGSFPWWKLKITGTNDGGDSFTLLSKEIPLAETSISGYISSMTGLATSSTTSTVEKSFSTGQIEKMIHDITLPGIKSGATITTENNVTVASGTLNQTSEVFEQGGSNDPGDSDADTKGFKEFTITRRTTPATTKTYSATLTETGGGSSDDAQFGGWTVKLTNVRNSDSVHLPLNLHHKFRLTRLQDNPRVADENEVSTPVMHAAMTVAQVEAICAPLFANYKAGSSTDRESTIGITKTIDESNNDVEFYFPRSGLDDVAAHPKDTEFTVATYGTDESLYAPLTELNQFTLTRVVNYYAAGDRPENVHNFYETQIDFQVTGNFGKRGLAVEAYQYPYLEEAFTYNSAATNGGTSGSPTVLALTISTGSSDSKGNYVHTWNLDGSSLTTAATLGPGYYRITVPSSGPSDVGNPIRVALVADTAQPTSGITVSSTAATTGTLKEAIDATAISACDSFSIVSPRLNATMTAAQIDAALTPIFGKPDTDPTDCTRSTSLGVLVDTFDGGSEIRIRIPNANFYRPSDSRVTVQNIDLNPTSDNTTGSLSITAYPCGKGAIPGYGSTDQVCLPATSKKGIQLKGQCTDSPPNTANNNKAPKFRQKVDVSSRTAYMIHFWFYLAEGTSQSTHSWDDKCEDQVIVARLTDEAGNILVDPAGNNSQVRIPLGASTVSTGESATQSQARYGPDMWHSSAGPSPESAGNSWKTASSKTSLCTPAILPESVYLEFTTERCLHVDVTAVIRDIYLGAGTQLYPGGPQVLIPSGIGYDARPDMEWTLSVTNNWGTDTDSVQRWLYQWGITSSNQMLPSKTTSADFN